MGRVAIIGGARTPFVKAGGKFSEQGLLDLSLFAVESLVGRLQIGADEVQELAFGTVLIDPRIPNLAREIVLRSESVAKSVGGHFVSNNCITGLVAVSLIAEAIRGGRIKGGIAGGAESMSSPALSLSRKADQWFTKLSRMRTTGERLKHLLAFSPAYLAPIPPSPKEPSTGLTMGQHCELMAQAMGIERATQDAIAYRSHMNAAKAQSEQFFAQEIVPFAGVFQDNIVRGDTSLEKLATLKPVFERSEKGTITAGNSSALTDGASAVFLMAEEEARRKNREILGFIEGIEFTSVRPEEGLLMAPVLAVPRLLRRLQIPLDEIDLFEIHEAFGAQVAANLKGWAEGWSCYPALESIGVVPEDKINIHGGSIALGHPFAATGGRLLTTLVNSLKAKSLHRGLISVCAAGGMGCALLVTRE